MSKKNKSINLLADEFSNGFVIFASASVETKRIDGTGQSDQRPQRRSRRRRRSWKMSNQKKGVIHQFNGKKKTPKQSKPSPIHLSNCVAAGPKQFSIGKVAQERQMMILFLSLSLSITQNGQLHSRPTSFHRRRRKENLFLFLFFFLYFPLRSNGAHIRVDILGDHPSLGGWAVVGRLQMFIDHLLLLNVSLSFVFDYLKEEKKQNKTKQKKKRFIFFVSYKKRRGGDLWWWQSVLSGLFGGLWRRPANCCLCTQKNRLCAE